MENPIIVDDEYILVTHHDEDSGDDLMTKIHQILVK